MKTATCLILAYSYLVHVGCAEDETSRRSAPASTPSTSGEASPAEDEGEGAGLAMREDGIALPVNETTELNKLKGCFEQGF